MKPTGCSVPLHVRLSGLAFSTQPQISNLRTIEKRLWPPVSPPSSFSSAGRVMAETLTWATFWAPPESLTVT